MQVTEKFEQDAKALLIKLDNVRENAKDCFNVYWKGGVAGDIAELLDADAVSQSTRLIKSQLTSGLVMAEALGNNMFEGNPVATGDYMATVQTLLRGNATPTLRTAAVEAYAAKIVELMSDCLDAYNDCWDLKNFYDANDMTMLLDGHANNQTETASGVTKSEIIAAVTLAVQFQNFINNVAVVQNSYKTTLGLWKRY